MREDGYYWVLLNGKGAIALWDSEEEEWSLMGQYMKFVDSAFEQIIERKLMDPWTITTQELPKK